MTNQIRRLNTIRALAAVIVFITHFSDKTDWLGGVLGGASGQYGVMLFFILSGFLMSHLYLTKDFNKANVHQYLFARIGRVVPLYLLVVFASYFLSSYGSGGLYDIPNLPSLISHLLFLSGDSVLWTIAPEIYFYLLFILFWQMAERRIGYVYMILVAILLLLFFSNFPAFFGDIYGVEYNFFMLLRSLPYFFVGFVFGSIFSSFKPPEYMKKHWFLLALLLIPLLYPELSPVEGQAKFRMWLNYEVLMVMATVFFCVVFLVPERNLLLENKVGDFIGKISYSLYLLHMPIIVQVNKLEVSVEMKLLLASTLSIFIAYLSYRYFEKPLANWFRDAAVRVK